MATYKFTKTQTTATGTSADDVFYGNNLANTIVGGGSTAGDASVSGDVYYVSKDDDITGGEGNDTFIINGKIGSSVLHGGTSALDFNGDTATLSGSQTLVADALLTNSDVKLNVAYRPNVSSSSATGVDTNATTVAGYNAVDTIEFKKSGNYSDLLFDGIERIELAQGVSITLSAAAFEQNGDDADRGALNGGFYVAGTAGGKMETLNITTEYEDTEYAATVNSITYYTAYSQTDFQLDDYSVADLFDDTNVNVIYDVQGDSDEDDEDDDSDDLPQYARVDGSNNSETVKGSNGVDNATMRLGDDTYYGLGGNDLLIGHGGADYLDGGTGNDIFVIGGFGSGTSGTTSKADDGEQEWIATGTKHDVIIGGAGTDTLRVTTGIGADTTANGTVVLNDDNFKQMEVVQVGGTVGRINTENAALQLINNHYYFASAGSVSDTSSANGNNGGTITNVVIDASGVTSKGLRFEGNAQANTFIGTTKADTFIGNSGNDTLTGNAGADKFVFGLVHQMTVTGSGPQAYADVATSLLNSTDTITDFSSSQGDKIVLNRDMFTVFNKTTGVVADNVVVASGHVAADSNDYLLFDTSNNTLYYDADGSGSSSAAVAIVTLTGVSSVSASDFSIG